MIKLVVSDLDGTLLDNLKKINEEFWSVEQQLSDRGIIFGAASGRQYYSILDSFQRIKERVIIIAENGSFVARNGEVIHRMGLDKPAARKFIEIARQIRNAYIIYCCENAAYIESHDEQFTREIRNYFKRVEIVDDLTKVEDYLLKFTICDFDGAEHNSLRYFKEFENEYKVVIAGKLFLDITNMYANKGEAVKIIQQKFNISPDETLVFGDYPNDMEMLEAATYNYAMKNAHPAILSQASFITDFDNHDNGVVRIIKQYCLNGSNGE